jgi:hypothetical protein
VGALINAPLLRKAAAAFLGIMEQKQFPEQVNTDEIQIVCSIPLPGFGPAPLTQLDGSFFSPNIAGANGETIYAVSNNVLLINNVILPAAGFDCLVDDISVFVTLNAAGAIAMNGKNITLSVFKVTTNGAINVYSFYDEAAWKITTGKTGYVWTLRGWGDINQSSKTNHTGRPILVPAGRYLAVSINVTDGSLWAAGSTWEVDAIAYTDSGAGTLRP